MGDRIQRSSRHVLIRRMLRVFLIGLPVTGIALGLAAECRPGWYAPLEPTAEVLERARAAAAILVDSIGDRMVEGRPFEIIISETMANEWLMAALHDRPDWAEQVPEGFSQPAIAFRKGTIHVGGRVEHAGWRAILSVQVELELAGRSQDLCLFLHSANLGALPLPKRVWSGPWERLVTKLRNGQAEIEIEPSSEISRSASPGPADRTLGIWLRNHFVWPNGRRPYQILGLSLTQGDLRLLIEPQR